MTPADFADLAVRGTAWLAMACYFLGAFLLLQTHGASPHPYLTGQSVPYGIWFNLKRYSVSLRNFEKMFVSDLLVPKLK